MFGLTSPRSDDDTFFPDYSALVRMLSEKDSRELVLIGALSESTKQASLCAF